MVGRPSSGSPSERPYFSRAGSYVAYRRPVVAAASRRGRVRLAILARKRRLEYAGFQPFCSGGVTRAAAAPRDGAALRLLLADDGRSDFRRKTTRALDLRKEFIAAVAVFGLVNVLLLVVNSIDVRWLWFGFVPAPGFDLA